MYAHLKNFLKNKSTVKSVEIDRFLGLDVGSVDVGRLLECDNVSVLRGGALKSLLKEEQIYVGESPSVAGIYTYAPHYDESYETYVSPSWIYKNVCPESLLNYAVGLENSARMFVIENGYKGKTENGYSNVLASFVDGDAIYVLYDATCTVIDQRRSCESYGVANGIVVSFDGSNSAEGHSTAIYNLTQLWLDVIKNGKITTTLIGGALKKRQTVSSNICGKATMFCEAGSNTFRYLSSDYIPSIQGSYSLSYDKVYSEVYPTANGYTPSGSEKKERKLIRYRNRADSVEGDAETFIYLPDMQLICGGETWSISDSEMPKLDGAVQHFERLFGFKGDRIYASVKGDCTDFTEGVDNMPISAGWQSVTPDKSGFTSIASFDGKVIAFTDKSMMTLKGTDLPFSLSYIGAYGCKSPDAVATYGGYMYFASQGGIMRYNGSSVKCISEGLSKDLSFADAKLSVSKGILVAELPPFKGFYLFNPESECWTYQSGEYDTSVIPSGDGGVIARESDGGYKLYKIFSAESGFSFSFFVGGGSRKRISAITVTASVKGGHLSIVSSEGEERFKISDTGGRVASRRYIPKNLYFDRDVLRFRGEGNVTLHSVFIEYKDLK